MRCLPLFIVGCLSACASPSSGPAPRAAAPDPPVAYVAGEPIRAVDLQATLYETAGAAVLADVVVDRMLADRLSQNGMTVTAADIDAERELLLRTLDPTDENQAARLLVELRQARGLGDVRFEALLRRNAGLRKLVADEVRVTPEMVSQQYELRYGVRYQPRIITADALRDLTAVRERLDAGESFSDLAAERSTDVSAAQGGLLSPISPVDPSYPQALRSLLPTLEPGQVSDPIALDGSFALVKLERKVEGQPVALDDVQEELTEQVRLRVEGALMNRLGRSLIGEARVTVLNPSLGESWRRQQAALDDQP